MNLIETPVGTFDLDDPLAVARLEAAVPAWGTRLSEEFSATVAEFLADRIAPADRIATMLGDPPGAVRRVFAQLLRNLAEVIEADAVA